MAGSNSISASSVLIPNRSISNSVDTHLQYDSENQSSPWKVSENPKLQLSNLPIEILTEIVEFTYQMTLDELPDSHPLISYQHIGGRPKDYTKPSAKTDIQNSKPPADLGGEDRKIWLKHTPGKWGPRFQIMFVSKLFYKISKPIRYREIHIIGGTDMAHGSWSCYDQILKQKILQEYTKYVNLKLYYLCRSEDVFNFFQALSALPKLKHLCITFMGQRDQDYRTYNMEYERFLSLKIETLTIIWAWNSSQFFPDGPHDFIGDFEHDYTEDVSIAEDHMRKVRSYWVRNNYTESSCYDRFEPNEQASFGKYKHIHDWTPTHRSNGKICSWEMDKFIVGGDKAISPCPNWNLWKNPYNHPDQLNDEELEAIKKLREWRKDTTSSQDEKKGCEIDFLEKKGNLGKGCK